MIPRTLKRTRTAIESGLIRLDGAVVRFDSRKHGSFAISLDEVAVIGEYTTDSGPFVDDWFVVFVHRDGVEWFEASMYAEELAEFLRDLAIALETGMETGLAASTDFASRVIWPPSIAGRPLFDFRTVTASSFLRRLKLAIIPEKTRWLSVDVVNAVKQRR
jgi:hypothetical protein